MNTQPFNQKNIQQRWLAIRLPALPLNCLGIVEDEPATLIEDNQRVLCVNKAAKQLGIKQGMDLTTAQLMGECQIISRDKQQEKYALQQIAQSLYQFTPYIQEFEQNNQTGLLLEVARCLKLFKGIVSLCENIKTVLKATQYPFVISYAHTAKAAWLLSFKPYPIEGEETKEIFIERLKSIRIAQLQGQDKNINNAIDVLHKSGFVALGDIILQIEKTGAHSLSKRFGEQFVREICDIFSLASSFTQSDLFQKPAEIFKPKEYFHENTAFDYPVANSQQLLPFMEALLEQLSAYLRQRQLETQSIEWRFYDIYNHQDGFIINADYAQTECRFFYELTKIKLEQYPLSFEVDSLELLCENTEQLQDRRQTLNFEHTKNAYSHQKDFNLLSAKLKARLGDDSLFKVSYADDHALELSCKKRSISEPANQNLAYIYQPALRPDWLFEIPQRIEEQSKGLYWYGYLNILSKPERIETHWWDKAVARDYFFAQRDDQLCFWIFWDANKKNWYVHGVFS